MLSVILLTCNCVWGSDSRKPLTSFLARQNLVNHASQANCLKMLEHHPTCTNVHRSLVHSLVQSLVHSPYVSCVHPRLFSFERLEMVGARTRSTLICVGGRGRHNNAGAREGSRPRPAASPSTWGIATCTPLSSNDAGLPLARLRLLELQVDLRKEDA
jgi:hypothetical protein